MEYVEERSTAFLGVTKLGRSTLQPAFCGQEINKSCVLLVRGIEDFYFGEIVAVQRGSLNVWKFAQLIPSPEAQTIYVELERGIRLMVKYEQVRIFIRKLVGAFYRADMAHSVPFASGGNGQPVQIGTVTFQPVCVGDECDFHKIRANEGFANVDYAIGEPVAVRRSGGNWTIAEVSKITSDGGLTVEVSRSLLTRLDKTFDSQTVKTWVRKLIGPFYLNAAHRFEQVAPLGQSTRQEHTSQQIQIQIEAGFRRRQKCQLDEHVQDIFRKHMEKTEAGFEFIPKEKVIQALRELDVVIHDDAADASYCSTDLNNDGYLDFKEFKAAVKKPSPVVMWASSFPLAAILADALPTPQDSRTDPIRLMTMMTDREIQLVAEGFCGTLKKLLLESRDNLKKALEKLDAQQVQSRLKKFEVNPMYCCKVDNLNFHEGLSRRLGPCNSDFQRGMELEHCSKAGATVSFQTDNYGIDTTPKKEWDIVVNRSYYDEKHNRKVKDIESLLQLGTAKAAKLSKSEAYSLVLCSGPMYKVYNCILRRYPDAEYNIYKQNMFSTTIFVLVSAVQKLARVTTLPDGLRLYRGLGGNVSLPKCFFESGSNGCKGYADWGFMSATSKRSVAMGYATRTGGKEKALPLLLDLKVGFFNGGARIQEFSQYEDEDEYLFVPCSFVEPDEQEPMLEVLESGAVTTVPARMIVNLKALTVEDQQSKKKETHIAAFRSSIDEIEAELNGYVEKNSDMLKKRFDSDIMKDKDKHSIDGFVSRINEQCKDIFSRHEALTDEKFSSGHNHRGLVWEMVDVKEMAIAKLNEWVQNTTRSFLPFRWNAPLRTAHRQWIHFLQREYDNLKGDDVDRHRKAAIELCKAKRLVGESLEERNDLDESRIMVAAAEGYSAKHVKLLIAAGANVNKGRSKDGVTAMWLAAQFGHAEIVQALQQEGADVNRAASDGATPLYIAAQNGNLKCMEMLAKLNAKLDAQDVQGMTALHQAAMNDHSDCIDLLIELQANPALLDNKGQTPLAVASKFKHQACAHRLSQGGESPSYSGLNREISTPHGKQLIVSSGDISDVDGLYAIAEYAKTGADVVFIMNYPAYVGVSEADCDLNYEDKNPGLGYKYSAREVFKSAKQKSTFVEFERYLQQNHGFNGEDESVERSNEAFKCALTDLAFYMVKKVWGEGPPNRGKLMFHIGGINSINPFSHKVIKNEIAVYCPLVKQTDIIKLDPQQGWTYNADGVRCEIAWRGYSDIYMDFNGSAAFWNDQWAESLNDSENVSKFRGVFVMGGVYAFETPKTSPSIPGVINRFSGATMNQLYHPCCTASLFAWLKEKKIEVFTVTNNEVADLRDLDNVKRFLSSHDLSGSFLSELVERHYGLIPNPPRKVFDFYTGFALASAAKGQPDMAKSWSKPMTLFYHTEFGMSLVSRSDDWELTLSEYMDNIDTEPANGDDDRMKCKKEKFKEEIIKMRAFAFVPCMPIHNLEFTLEDSDHHFSLKIKPN